MIPLVDPPATPPQSALRSVLRLLASPTPQTAVAPSGEAPGVFWRCVCGASEVAHRTNCPRCGNPRPLPVVEKPPGGRVVPAAEDVGWRPFHAEPYRHGEVIQRLTWLRA